VVDSRKKPGVAFWATVLVVAGLAYPLSVGPACWASSRIGIGTDLVSIVYKPLFANRLPYVADCLDRYSRLGAPEHWTWQHIVMIPTDDAVAIGTRNFWASDAPSKSKGHTGPPP
jgi:hypothetical protein